MQFKGRTIFAIALMINITSYSQDTPPLPPCPKSPNCICSLDKKSRKRINALEFNGDILESKNKLKEIILSIEGTILAKEESNYLYFEFSTSIGKYIDDVVFYFDTEVKQIHFRSASRKGYGDFGANKRRMKRITKIWDSY